MAYQSSKNDILDLSRQSLKKVPKSILKNLNIKELNLSNNELTELPDFITELRYLEVLKLRDNKLKIAPELILKFRYLKTLSLSENEIKIIPQTFSALNKLEDFDIGSNPLTEFPQWIDKLYNLKDLGIYDLKLKQLPDVVTRIRSLEILSLDGNDLVTLPDTIDNLRYLKELWAEGNCFAYFPERFGNLNNLERVNFGVNKIKQLPESLSNLRKLIYLNVSENEITHLPTHIGNLSQLENLDVSYNKITTLPASFSRLNNKKTEVWLDANPYTEATKREIKRLFPYIKDSDLEPPKPELEDVVISDTEVLKPIEPNVKKDKKIDTYSIKEKNDKPLPGCLILMIGSLVIFIIFVLFNSNNDDPITEANKRASNEYNTVFTLYKKNRDSLLKSNKSIYVYTNDTTSLKAKFKPNVDIYINPYAPYYSNTASKTEALTKILNNKHLGFNVVLDNNRVKLNLARIHDSVFNKQAIKKYSLVVDYKMSAAEIEVKKKHESKLSSILNKDKDTVFNSEKIILTSKELADKKISNSMRALLAPIIDLDNKDYHFYFAPNNNRNNYTKQEFIEAIEDFKALFLKGNKNKNPGVIREILIETEVF